MLRTTQTCLRAASPILQRHASRVAPLASAAEMSTNASSKDSKPSKEKPKSASSQPAKDASVTVAEPVDKGDSYRAGEEFFSFDSYSFYDIENSVRPHRCPQPSSEKMKEFCLDKLNPEEEIEPRKLLAEDYGDLEEYPGKPIPRRVEVPVPPVMRRSYGLNLEASVDSQGRKHMKARMPL
ncbi:hypothetical protein EGW08_008674 [Elysia chlorotica]|uniref:Uncharacterized protein n=1 Tax=Elysia chlorotica TaxID=188477 RepID=A0A3S1BGP5_ELYCH|nr:hypothetical protein EGW08_008674 [Elysia chlorotica]